MVVVEMTEAEAEALLKSLESAWHQPIVREFLRVLRYGLEHSKAAVIPTQHEDPGHENPSD